MNFINSGVILLLVAVFPYFGKCQNIPEGLVLKSLDNKSVYMEDVLGKDIAIVAFWATWCKPCQNELEALADLQDEWKDKVRVLAVSIDDARSVAKVKSLVKGKKWPYEVLLDSNKELYKALNLISVPFVMIISGGETVWSHAGYVPGDEEIVVKKALAERARYLNQKVKSKSI